MKRQAEVLVRDRLRSSGAALKDLGVVGRQETDRWLNNRAENTHLLFRRRQRPMQRFLLDIDHLKRTNDVFGHDAGDALLTMFAKRLRDAVGDGGTVARLGGDEFAGVLNDIASRKDVAAASKRIITAMMEPFLLEDVAIECRPSIGASYLPSHGTTTEELIKSADLALYTAKSTARGSLVFFKPKMLQEARGRRRKLACARIALEEDRIEPFYQPKIELATGAVTGFEALLRWRRKPGPAMAPAGIAPAFEDFDLAAEISDRMMSRTIRDARAWLDQGVHFGSIALNAGAVELQDKDFAARFLRHLNAYDVPRSRFQLEVVETVLLGRGTDHIEVTLRQLSQEGVKIALDDFGTGYASLTHLQKYPVDILKIDRSFVGNIGRSGCNTAIVDAIIGISQSLGVSVVAEGVEMMEQANHLREIGCAYGQGYLFSKALPTSRVPGFLKSPLLGKAFKPEAGHPERQQKPTRGRDIAA